jgi:glycosyl transferase family 25
MDFINNIPIYWINLNRSEDRRKYFEKQLENYNINNHKRIEGVDGLCLDFDDYKNNIKENLSKSELGCTLSHIKAIKEAFGNNEEYVLIMEDDCNFEYLKFQKKSIRDLIDFMNEKFKDWDILQLATCNRQDHNIRLSNEKEYICRKFRNCTTCYLINKKGIYKYINLENKIFSQADYFIYENANTYHVTKPYFTYNYSNIHSSTVHYSTKYTREDSSKKFWDEYYATY